MDDAKFWLIVSQWPEAPLWPDDTIPDCPKCQGTGFVGSPNLPMRCGRCSYDYTAGCPRTGHDAAE